MATTGAVGQRIGALLVLLVLGMLSLPVTAYFLDGEGTENWILPVAAVVMGVVGAVVGRLLPGLAGEEVSSTRAILVGAVVGVGMLVIGVIVFFLLLNGFSGA